MQAVFSEAIQELRRPFRLRGSTSRRAFAGLVLLTAAGVLILAGLGSLLAEPSVTPAASHTSVAPFDALREPFMLWFASVPQWIRFFIGMALLPLLFAMVRRSTDIGLPKALSVAGVVVLVVSAMSFLFALDQRVEFPLTRGLWAIVAADAEDLSSQVGIGIVMSPFFLVTLIADLLIILLVGFAALTAAVLSALAAAVIACMPTRTEVQS